MADSQYNAGKRLLALDRLSTEQAAGVDALARILRPTRPFPPPNARDLPAWLMDLLKGHRYEEAADLAAKAEAAGEANWEWAVADRLAGTCLHLGRPDLARRLWQRAKGMPSPAVLQSRLGDTFWVEGKVGEAVGCYEAAHRLDPRLADPCWALAWLHAQRGDAEAGLRACWDGLALSLPDGLRTEQENLEKLLRRYARPDPGAK
jgi:tetratricopeptide (TPR) repeat protein